MLLSALFNAADLEGASLRHADLTFAVLNGAAGGGGLLVRAAVADGVPRCPSLARARGLDTVEPLNPSSIDLATLRQGLEHLPDELLASLGVDAEQCGAPLGRWRTSGVASATSVASGATTRGSTSAAALPCRADLRGDSGHQIGRHAELAQLSRTPVRTLASKVNSRRTRRRSRMLLDQVHLGVGQPAVEEVVQPAERLFAGGPVQGMAHRAPPVA